MKLQLIQSYFPRFLFTLFAFGDVYWELTSAILIVWGEDGDLEYMEAQMLADIMRFVFSFIGGQGNKLFKLYLISKTNCFTILGIVQLVANIAWEMLGYVRAPIAYLSIIPREDDPRGSEFRPKFAFEAVTTKTTHYMWALCLLLFFLTMAFGQFATIFFVAGSFTPKIICFVIISILHYIAFFGNLIMLLRGTARMKRVICGITSCLLCLISTAVFIILAGVWFLALKQEAESPSTSANTDNTTFASILTGSTSSIFNAANPTKLPRTLTSMQNNFSTIEGNTDIHTPTQESAIKNSSTEGIMTETTAKSLTTSTSEYSYCNKTGNRASSSKSILWLENFEENYTIPNYLTKLLLKWRRKETCCCCAVDESFVGNTTIHIFFRPLTSPMGPLTGGLEVLFNIMLVANVLHCIIFISFVIYCMSKDLYAADLGRLGRPWLDAPADELEMNRY